MGDFRIAVGRFLMELSVVFAEWSMAVHKRGREWVKAGDALTVDDDE